MKTLCAALLIASAVGIAGCGAGDAGKATEEDKKNLTNLIENGIGSGPPGSAPAGNAPAQGTPPPSASGNVEPP